MNSRAIANVRTERGIAMVLALFLMSVLSVLGASMMFLSQTETYATMNYRMMSQARYAAEGGIQRASNFLLDVTQYTPPVVEAGQTDSIDDFYKYDVSPVVCKTGAAACTPGQAIVLSSVVGQSNYPDTTKKAAFAAIASGNLSAGTATLTYTTTATLLTMQYFESYVGKSVVQTWKIESTGSISAGRTATVEVMALVETPKVPASGYAAFATSDVCGALSFAGHLSTDSYDSTGMTGATTPASSGTRSTSGGNVGTNGNLTLVGGANVGGNLYTPRTGVGTCNSASANAYTGDLDSVDSIVQLPAVVTYPDPTMPSVLNAAPFELNASTLSSACGSLGLSPPQCSVSGNVMTLDATTATNQEIHLPQLTINGNFRLQIVSGSPNKYDMNSLSLLGNAEIQVKTTSANQAAVVNIVGQDQAGGELSNPLNLGGGSEVAPDCSGCSNYDASLLKFVYGGEGEIDLFGNSEMIGTLYAPNAYVDFSGTYDLYGSVIAATLGNAAGSPTIHYDRRLTHDLYMPGHPAAGTFTWKRAS